MKTFKTTLLLIAILAALSINATAQNRPQKTASARAYYGEAPSKPKFKKKRNQRIPNYTHTKPAKGTKPMGRTTKRRYAHS